MFTASIEGLSQVFSCGDSAESGSAFMSYLQNCVVHVFCSDVFELVSKFSRQRVYTSHLDSKIK